MRNQLLATVFTVSAAPSLFASTENTFEHTFSTSELTVITKEELRPISGRESSSHKLNFMNLSNLALGRALLLDLTGYSSFLKEVILPTTATNIKVPAGTRIKLIGSAQYLNLSKIVATTPIQLDLSEVTGMDKPYDATGRNSIPASVSYVHFPSNAKEISIPSNIQTVIAEGAEVVHLHGGSTVIPSSLEHLPKLKELNISKVTAIIEHLHLSHLKKLGKLTLNPSRPPISVRLDGEIPVTLTNGTGLKKVIFTGDKVKKDSIDAVRPIVSQVELVSSKVDHASLLGGHADFSHYGDTIADKDAVVHALRLMGITNIKQLKIKASHANYVFDKLGSNFLTGFTILEEVEFVDENNTYGEVSTLTNTPKEQLFPSTLKTCYSSNFILVKGAISGALDHKFNATHMDLSEATLEGFLSAGEGFLPAAIRTIHLPTNIDLSIAGNQNFIASLTTLERLYTYGDTDIAGLTPNKMPDTVTHLNISNSTATSNIPDFNNHITHVEVSAAYLSANDGSNKFEDFVEFTGSSRTLFVIGSANDAPITTTHIPNVGTLNLQKVTGATGFTTALDKTGTSSNLTHLYLPSGFELPSELNPNLLTNVDGDVTVYVSGNYPTERGSINLISFDPNLNPYQNCILNFEHATGGGLFQVPSNIRGLIFNREDPTAVRGVSAAVAAELDTFDLADIPQLTTLQHLPSTAVIFRLNNTQGTLISLDLQDHTRLTELSLNASKVSYLHLPKAAGLIYGGFAGEFSGHLNLSGITGLAITEETPEPLAGLADFTKLASQITVVSLPRALPSDCKVDLSTLRPTISVRNLHRLTHVVPHPTAAHLVKPNHSHGVHDRANVTLWYAYLAEALFSTTVGGLSEKSLDLSETPFSGDLITTQNELYSFFTALNLFGAGETPGNKGYLQNIHMRFADSLNAGTLYLGKMSATSFVSGFKDTLRISVHKHDGLTVEGVGFISNVETQTYYTTPGVSATHEEWTAWIEQQAIKSSTHLDLSTLEFLGQEQLDTFFQGLSNATNKTNITRIDIGFDPTYQGGAVLGQDETINPITGLNNDLIVFTHAKPGDAATGAGNGDGQIDNNKIHAHLSTPAINAAYENWTAWIEQQILRGVTHLDLTGHQFASQDDLNRFFHGLSNTINKTTITRIDLGFNAGYVGAAVLGQDTNNAPLISLNNDLIIFTHGKQETAATGAGNGDGQIDNNKIHAHLSTPTIDAAHENWKEWIQQHAIKGVTHLDLSALQFATQNELNTFFHGLGNATNKTNITRIDIGFDPTYQGGAVLGQDETINPIIGFNNDLIIFTHGKQGDAITGAGNGDGQIDTAKIHTHLSIPAIDASDTVWKTWIEQQAIKSSTHLDLSALEFENQDQVDTFFYGLHQATNKANIIQINLNVAAAYTTNTIILGRQNSANQRVTGLNTNLVTFVDKALKPAVEISGIAGAAVGEIATANVHSNSASTTFDKGAAYEWHSYIMHQLTQGKAVLDLKDTTLASDEQATALISALAELPLHLKEKVRGILVKLEGGNLPEGSFITEAGHITLNLTNAGLSALEYLFIDLNETQENNVNVVANVTGLHADKVISMNPHA